MASYAPTVTPGGAQTLPGYDPNNPLDRALLPHTQLAVAPNSQASSDVLGAQLSASPAAQPQTPQGQYGLDPSLSAYLDQFNSSLANSRKSIDTQLAQAMGELGQRRDAAAKVVAGLPGEIGRAYAPAQAGLQQAGVAGQGALSQDVRGQVGALAGPLQSALAMEKGGGNAMQPYLNLANQANYGAGAGALRQQAMIGQQALDQRQQDFVQSLMQNQLQRQQSNDDFYAHSLFADQLQRGDKANDIQVANQQSRDQLAQSFGLKDEGDLTSIENSPAYKYAVHSMTNGLYNNGVAGTSLGPLDIGTLTSYNHTGDIHHASGAEIAQKYKGNPDLLKALLANHYLTPGDLAGAGIQLPTGK